MVNIIKCCSSATLTGTLSDDSSQPTHAELFCLSHAAVK